MYVLFTLNDVQLLDIHDEFKPEYPGMVNDQMVALVRETVPQPSSTQGVTDPHD
jgi:hypothetical protein